MFPRTAAAPLALLASSAVTLVAAQTTLTDVIAIPGFEGPNEASVVSADASVTVLVMNCPSGTPSDECGIPPGFTVTVGPSTWAWGILTSEEGISVTERLDCSLDRNADTAVCTFAGVANVDATVTDTDDLMTTGTFASSSTLSSDISEYVYAVTVTGGLDKLEAAATATGTTVAETGSTRPTATGTGSSGATATGTGASASSTSTADSNGGISLKAGGVWMGVVLGAAVTALL